ALQGGVNVPHHPLRLRRPGSHRVRDLFRIRQDVALEPRVEPLLADRVRATPVHGEVVVPVLDRPDVDELDHRPAGVYVPTDAHREILPGRTVLCMSVHSGFVSSPTRKSVTRTATRSAFSLGGGRIIPRLIFLSSAGTAAPTRKTLTRWTMVSKRKVRNLFLAVIRRRNTSSLSDACVRIIRQTARTSDPRRADKRRRAWHYARQRARRRRSAPTANESAESRASR